MSFQLQERFLSELMAQLLHITDLRKKFGPLPVLKGIEFSLEKGEIVGLLGINGAGKTTLIRCLLQLLSSDEGSFRFRGQALRIHDIHHDFGFLPENFSPPRSLSGREFLSVLCGGIGRRACDIDALLDKVGLNKARDACIRTYSRGMLQRLGISAALLKSPEVLVLDEPTLGLDPLGQKHILDLLLDLNREGRTIFFSSHILFQMEQVCTRIAILHQGRITYTGGVQELLKRHSARNLDEAFLREIDA